MKTIKLAVTVLYHPCVWTLAVGTKQRAPPSTISVVAKHYSIGGLGDLCRLTIIL